MGGFLSISLETSLPDSAAVAMIPLSTLWPRFEKKKKKRKNCETLRSDALTLLIDYLVDASTQ